ncbi:MAG: hypothetical protein LAO30_07280 [Acidobacteriia bacterium]|nr:hypothetical protein [Terriglobia bacterium]
MRISSGILVLALPAVAAFLVLASSAFGQIQSTIVCPSGRGYWDVLSVMMMDPGLASNYHMEGITNGLPSSYVYTLWDQSQSKVYYVKNPQGNPWDINLYDSNYIYQWITELGIWDGVNHWNDPTSCRKFNNGSQNATADLSMRWAARCATPGGKSSTFWNSPPSVQPNNTNYYTYVDQLLQDAPQDLGYSRLELKRPGAITITDQRANPPRQFPITTLPLQYTYSCTVAENIRSCKFREVFEYGVDTGVNPVDNLKHSYGWIRWRYYINSSGGNPEVAPTWVLSNTSTSDQLMPGQVSLNFQCF